MKIISILLICSISILAYSQVTRFKNINIIEEDKKTIDINIDTSQYYIHRIDTLEFKNILNSNNKIFIQFWQPWCGGVKEWINNLNRLFNYAKNNDITFLLISDSKFEENYFINSEKKIGILTKYYNEYHLKQKSYIISKGFDLETYKKIISKFLEKRINQDFLGYYIENKKIIYQNSSYKFYNHFLK
jgi:thiol-disulfide isomerase/thioredoxin